MKNKKIVIASSLLSIALFLGVSQAQAASNWKDYFTKDEASSMRKMISKYIQDQIEQNKSSWRGVISGKNIKKNSITADNIKEGAIDVEVEDGAIDNTKLADGAVTSSKLAEGAVTATIVDDSVAKRVIYTATNPRDPDDAGYVYTDVLGGKTYFIAIDAPEVAMSDNPAINFYINDASNMFPEETWTPMIGGGGGSVFFGDGVIYFSYGTKDTDDNYTWNDFDECKVTVIY